MKNLITLLFLSISLLSFSQDEIYYKDYDWKTTPEKFELTQEEIQKDQVTISEKKLIQFLFQKEQIVKCIIEHKIIRLNNDKAIENNNKFYVSNYGSIEVIKQKARVIKPNGKIIELSVKDIKTATDENGNPEYQYFAFEGIEIGSVIEYFHMMIFPANFTGDEIRIQNQYLKKNVEYEIVAPSHLEFKIKSINGLPDFTLDTTETKCNKYVLHTSNIEGAEVESSCSYGANLKKFYFMLFKNTASGKSNFYNYQDVTKNIYGNMFAQLTSKEEKLIKKFIKSSAADVASTTIEKVRLLENYIKSTIGVQENDFENAENIQKILENKVTNEDGATKLMMNCLRNLNINFELVVTCDRTENKFISDFQGYNFLKQFMIYVNELDSYYIASIISRLGFPPTEFIHTEGLFIKEVKIGDLTSSIGAIKKIKGKKMEDSVDEIITNVSIADDQTTTVINIERKTTGYKAIYQSFIDYVEETQRKEIKDSYLNYIDNESKPENMVFQNDSSKYYGVKPLIAKGTIKSPNFIEHAGDKLLFKIGMLIGPQSNLYNSKERKFPVETEHLRKYDRVITFEIPQGYTIKNLNDLNLSVQPTFENNAIGFVSKYELKDNKLIVYVNEWYNTVLVPVADYKSYEDVVNAAADFNKLVIVLQKK
jgi:hypothetical protein